MPADLAPWFAALFPAAGYLLGSVSAGLLVAGRHGIDLRAKGSGNTGATNVSRLMDKRAGRLVLVLDALKGAIPTLIARVVLGQDHPLTAATGVAAAVGHVLPIWHGFRGGKGAATAAGVLLAVEPVGGAAGAFTYVLLRKLTRRSSIGSLAGALVGCGVTSVLWQWSAISAMAICLFAVVVVRHADNIGRILRGEEPPS